MGNCISATPSDKSKSKKNKTLKKEQPAAQDPSAPGVEASPAADPNIQQESPSTS